MTAYRRWIKSWRRRRAAKARGGKRLQAKLLTVTLLVLGGTFAYALNFLAPSPTGKRLTIDQFSALADERRITTAAFQDEDAMLTGAYECQRPPLPKGLSAKERKAATAARRASPAPVCDKGEKGETSFWLPYPKSDLATSVLLQTVTEAGATVSVDPQTAKAQVRLITTFLLPLVILANLFALLFSLGRQGSSGIGEVIVFGSLSRGRVRRGRRVTPVTFDDVGGADHAVTELAEVVDYLRAPERYQAIGAQPPRGILMIGPPGCGKTLLAKAAAGEAKVPFFSVAGAEFVESLVGVGAARVRDLFQRVRAVAPAIVFIDELDAAGRRRGAGGGGGGSDEREQTLNQLLVEMDGFEASSGIVVIGATNRPDILDPALLRPGRFDRHVSVDQPDRDGRRAILELHARGRKVASGVDLDVLARRTPGFSGADLANVLNEAALLAVRQNKLEIALEDLFEAVERVLAGPQRRGRVLSAAERRRAALHESGHAIVSSAFEGAEAVHRVSILARGRTLGSASVARDIDAELMTRSDLERQLAEALGGIAAEVLVLGEESTGAERDLERATGIARDLAARYGMSDELGRARLLGRDSEAFIDGETPLATLSAITQQQLDQEVRALLERAERRATAVLAANAGALEAMAARLETEEIIEGDALVEMLGSIRPATVDKARAKRKARVPG